MTESLDGRKSVSWRQQEGATTGVEARCSHPVFHHQLPPPPLEPFLDLAWSASTDAGSHIGLGR